MSAEVMKVESCVSEEVCAVCGGGEAGDLRLPEEHDGFLPPGAPPLRSMLLHLAHNKAIPSGPVCSNCVLRTSDAYELSTALSKQAAQPLSEKIRALRKRLHDLTEKIDVFIVVGSQTQEGGTGTYSEEDIIMVERSALAAAAADDELLERANNARGDNVYQCSVCPQSFQRVSEFRSHSSQHAADARHSCWTCGAQYSSREELVLHQRVTHRPADQHQPPHCQLCNTSFQSQCSLRAHQCPSVCPVCGELYPDRASLSLHVTSSHAGDSVGDMAGETAGDMAACPTCYRVFPDSAQLTAHKLTHRHARQYVCGYDNCILRFATRNTLISHIRKCHGGEVVAEGGQVEGAPEGGQLGAGGEVPCPQCYRTFGSVAAMKRHARVHRNDLQKQESESVMMMEGVEGEEVEYLEVETLEGGEGEGPEGGEGEDSDRDVKPSLAV